MKGEECGAILGGAVMLMVSSALMVYFSVLHIRDRPEYNVWTYPLVMGVLLVMLVASVAALVSPMRNWRWQKDEEDIKK